MPILQTTDLKKYYGDEPNITKALDGVSLSVEHGEFVAIVGTSGSGKSTLLNMIGGLDVPTSGKVIVDGKDLSTLKDEQLTIFRRRKIGFIFQNYNLVPVLNVYENIVLPVELDGDQVDKKYMQEVVRMLGLEDKLCTVIDNILLNEKPADFEAFLQKLEQQGYEIKRGKHTSVKGARQKRFIRFRTLGAGYSEDEIKAVIAGEAEHRPHQKQPPKEKPFHLLVDIQAKLSEGKSESYARWAKRYNLKEMSKTLIFLQENKIGNIEEMQERVNAATARYHELGDSIKAAEQRMAEIAVLRAHIINYAKTRPVYDAYRKAGYSKKFLEEHREQITLHRAAKATFDEAGLKKLPKVKELNTEYSTLLSQKKAAYPAYRKARDEMQELMKAQKNVEIFFAEEKTTKEKAQTR